MNLWFEYVNACNSMYAEYIRNTRKMTESWLDLFQSFGQGSIERSKSRVVRTPKSNTTTTR